MELGNRLAAVAGLVLPAETLADVGCDHGYLSIYLTEQKRCNKMIAMDVNEGPLQKAEENIEKYNCKEYIETRLSDGLEKLLPGEADGYICAGMGGKLALQILWNDRDKVKDMKQIILQPQSELWLVRRTLKKWGFVIEKEDIAFEDDKYYFMMLIRPGEQCNMEEAPDENAAFPGPDFMEAQDEYEVEMISESGLKNAAYELFAKELVDAKNEILKEYIRKEEARLIDVYKSLLQQEEESVKVRTRRDAVEKELVIHQWVLGRFR